MLLERLIYDGNGQHFEIPTGFVTDLASIPWWAGWLLDRVNEKHARAGILHDWIYRTKEVTRSEADRLFLRVMLEDGNGVIRAYVMWSAVRTFGWIAWGGRG